ncbi:hypothetical protein OAQ99_02970 [Candidatus Kapabacteria bacterium]|nr:hypothetical protein [Candidatus Kapabacteria bacterium]
MSETVISQSSDLNDYEILIRKRGENQYASYCPQLNLMLTGVEHEAVREKMYNQITQHIESIAS